ncbi:MFS transporter [Kribbella sp. NPDC026611]|uniref:MFS transporter n=1 Tax=Kribbella sp. NPDC026611 TaxID=3154911 RepID=UPI0033F7CD3F
MSVALGNDVALRRGAVATMCGAPLVVLVNYALPIMTMPDIARSLGAGVSAQVWILNGAALGLGSVLIAAGTVADAFGRRRVLMAGAALLALSSLVAGAADRPMVFVLARMVQGVASAMLLAASLGMLGHTFAGSPARPRLAGLWGSAASAGIASGPLLSSVLAEVWTWRAAYWLICAGSMALWAASARLLPESRPGDRRQLDLLGLALLGLGLVTVLAGLTEARQQWNGPVAIGLLVAGGVLMIVFGVVEALGRTPMLDLALFRSVSFVVATGGAFMTGLTVVALMSCLPVMLQELRGLGALAAAGLFASWSGTAAVVAQQARGWRFGGRLQLGIGLVVAGAGTVLLVSDVSHWSLLRIGAALGIAGIGTGLVNSALPGLAVASVPADRGAMGSGTNNAARYIGSSVGVAIMVAFVTRSGALNDHGLDRAILVAAAAAEATGVLILATRLHRSAR